MLNHKTTLTSVAAAVLVFASSFAALAQTTTGAGTTTTTSTTTSTSSNPTASRLAGSYSEIVGSQAAAADLIGSMRAGETVTINGVEVSGAGKTMGYGNINHALSLAKAEAAAIAAADGNRTVTPTGFLSALDKVMDMRVDGMGWGQIAKELGFNLGQVISASKSNSAAAKSANAARSGQSSSVAQGGKDKGQGGGSDGKGGGQGHGGNANAGGNGGGNGGGGGGKK